MVQSGSDIIKVPVTEIDTSTNYVRKGKNIYNFGDNNLVYKGEFNVVGDTVVIYKPTEPEEHCLNNNIILKKVGKYYILNIREDNGFWQVIQLEKNSEGDILLKILDNDKLIEVVEKEKLLELISPNFDKDSEESRDYYYSGNLLKEEILNLIDTGAFLDALINLSHTHKLIAPYYTQEK